MNDSEVMVRWKPERFEFKRQRGFIFPEKIMSP